MRSAKVYTLTNPTDNSIFYVGSTYVRLNQRLNIHVCSAKNRPQGEVGRYMNKLTVRPVIEELESFNSISSTELRKAELFWVRQLKSMGFPILNSQDPYNDKVKSRMSVPAEEIEYLKGKMRFIHYVSFAYNIKGLYYGRIQKILRTGVCYRSTYATIQLVIKYLKSLDYSRFVLSPKTLMIKLTDTQRELLIRRIEGNYFKAQRVSGLHYHTLMQASENGIVRFDKEAIINKFINTPATL